MECTQSFAMVPVGQNRELDLSRMSRSELVNMFDMMLGETDTIKQQKAIIKEQSARIDEQDTRIHDQAEDIRKFSKSHGKWTKWNFMDNPAVIQTAALTRSNPGRCPGLLQFKPFGLFRSLSSLSPKGWNCNSPGQRPGLERVRPAV